MSGLYEIIYNVSLTLVKIFIKPLYAFLIIVVIIEDKLIMSTACRFPIDCSAPYAVETVMQICHGKRRCFVVANRKTFGSPCNLTSKAYLKIAYACGK